MWIQIKTKITGLRRNLSTLDNQPVGRAALTILILLDLFILGSIFDGLSDHTRQLATPHQSVPQYCRDIVIEAEWNQSNRLERLARIVRDNRNRYYWPDDRERTRPRHPVCEPIARLFLSIEDDDGLSKNLKDYLNIDRETSQLNAELRRAKSAYDTSLLQAIAEQDTAQANIDSLKAEIEKKTAQLNAQAEKRSYLLTSLQEDKRIRELFAIIDGLAEADREALRDDLRTMNFWYPVKRLGMEMLFLLPLLMAFYFWNSKAIARQRPFQKLVSSHLLVVAFIPAMFKVMELIYDIIPKKLLQQLIELLESLKLVAIWHYLLMAIVIVSALAMIYLFQKKLFSHEKLIERRIARGECQNCGKHLPEHAFACPFCGFEQYRPCRHCNKLTYVYGRYCRECGQETNNEG